MAEVLNRNGYRLRAVLKAKPQNMTIELFSNLRQTTS
jgi:hypothetical protein